MLVTKHNSKKKTTPVWSYKETQLFRKTTRHNCLERQLKEGRTPGRRRKGRPRRRWTDDIKDNMNTSLENASRIAQDREGFREFIGKTTFWKKYVTILILNISS